MMTNRFSVEMYYRRESGWSIPDENIKAIYAKMQGEGKTGTVFSDACIDSAGVFMDAMQNGNNWLFVISSDSGIIGVMWLNRREGRMARVHFCTFDSFSLSEKIEASKHATDHVLGMRDEEGFLFDCLVGYIPGFNKAAIMFVMAAGFTRAGEIPMCLVNSATGDSETAVILYKNRKRT